MMDWLAIMALIEKGLAIAGVAIEAGGNAMPIITRLKDLVTGAQKGTITNEERATVEAFFDEQLAQFNEELPPADGA